MEYFLTSSHIVYKLPSNAEPRIPIPSFEVLQDKRRTQYKFTTARQLFTQWTPP